MGLTSLDTGVIIGLLDASDPFHVASRQALAEALAQGRIHVPAVVYAESSIAVIRAGWTVDLYNDVLARLPVEIGTVTQQVAARAAELRAATLSDRRRRQWKMPDALVIADAFVGGADRVVTTDSTWPPLGELIEVRVLARGG